VRLRLPGIFETMSGVPVEPVYAPDEAELPGKFPYTKGAYVSMYTHKRLRRRQETNHLGAKIGK
jgi:hypothetical protein